MTKEKLIKTDGIIKEVLPDLKFRVKLLKNNFKLIAYTSGKIRQNHIKIIKGDKVSLEISSYNINKGRIIFRYK